MSEEKDGRMFPKARIVSEGTFKSPQGDQVQTIYVDLSGEIDTTKLCVVKGTEPQNEPLTRGTIRLSRPPEFQKAVEAMIRDEQEGRPRTSTQKTEEVPDDDAALREQRTAALNAALQLGRMKISVKGAASERRSHSTGASMTFGLDWLVYSTSIRPSAKEKAAWRNSLPSTYTSVTPIYRSTQFAQGLGLGVCEYIGVRGKARPVRTTYEGFGAVEEQRRTQLVIHGPMLYVDEPYGWMAEAGPGWEKIWAMIFLKSRDRDYAAQKEYRFAVLSVGAEVGEVFDMPLSGILRDCLEPVGYPDGEPRPETAVVSGEDSPPVEEKRTRGEYTYGRRVTRRRWSGLKKDDSGTGETKEEVFEETVTSPDELPEPFPNSEDRRPDVVVIQEWEGRLRLVHHASREDTTMRWRVETVQVEAAKGALSQAQPSLAVPPSLRYGRLDRHPMDPRVALEMLLNPSVSKPPIPYGGRDLLNEAEIGHVLACGESVRTAVDLLAGEDRAKAAGSAWYAQRFILDLVCWFGPIVKSVCVIRDGVMVVELVPAPLSGATGWATFSGARTYTLYVRDRNLEEYVFPGDVSRTGVMRPEAYGDTLVQHGWARKARRRR